jgi:hypothetical protein
VNADWFYSVGDTRQGPVTEDDLKRLVADGQLKPTDLVWRDGMADWVEARTVESLFPREERRRPKAEDEGAVRRRLDSAFDGAGSGDRPSRRGRRDDDEYRDEDDRPSRRGRPRDDADDDRPSARGRRSVRDEYDEDDDRPRPRRSYDDRDDYDDRPRRRRAQKPGQVQAVGIMLLVGGILGLLTMAAVALSSMGICCLWPGIYFEIVWGILALIRGINMLNQDDQGPPKTLAILQIICIVNADVINCILGIVCLVMLGDEQVRSYYRRRGFDA